MTVLDFHPFLEIPHEHQFTLLGLQGCIQCDKLFEAFAEAHRTCMLEKPISLVIRKIDATTSVFADKPLFVKKLIEEFDYLPREDGKVHFPVVIYNGKYLGGYREAYGKFASIVDDLLD